MSPLTRAFFLRATADVARDLLGRYLVLDREEGPPCIGAIVETEAYVGEHDLASHTAHGRTARTAPMFGEAGRAYLYLIYGMHWCLNVVTEAVDRGCAVLLRALEPVAGIDSPTDGPGKLCRALGIDKRWNAADLISGDLRLTRGCPVPPQQIGTSARIGVAYAGQWAQEPLRFFVTANPYVSRYPGHRSKRIAPEENR
ncbi:MAG: DNA-3-methyladenine glycosylase [Chloroflexi bacterium]|nr:DNA-3-methyladenine glycosylase [Chloroflexota bacterium]